MEIQDRILQKADELFKRYGIRAVTLDEISTALGISKKTIYQSFEDKDALVDAVMEIQFEKKLKNCGDCKVVSKDAIQEIFLMMEKMDEDLRNINPIILFDLKKFHHTTFLKFNQFMNEHLMQMIVQNLQRGIDEGLYRENINIQIASRYRIASVWLLFDVELFPPKTFDIAKVSREILELFLYGLVNPKGYKLIEKYQNKK